MGGVWGGDPAPRKTEDTKGTKMIEKLPFEITQGKYEGKKFDIKSHTSPFDMQVKINELVDAVNELQISANRMGFDKPKENKQDPYAEQRKWIGKLCKFWDDSDKPENCVYDILCNIFDITHHEDCPFQCGNGEWYEYCEPVKPDDDIIYKGE